MAYPGIVIPGVSGNPNIRKIINYYQGFQAFGVQQVFIASPESVAHSDVSGVQRVSGVTPFMGAGARTEATDLKKPAYLPGGGPNGLTDSAYFDNVRGDLLVWGVPGPLVKHTLVEIIRPELLAANGAVGHLSSGNNSGLGGKNLFYISRNNDTVSQVVSFIDGTTGGFNAQSSLTIPLNAWFAAVRTWDPTTRVTRVGIVAPGGTSITWAVGNPGPNGTAPTNSSFQFGGESGGTTRSFKGQWAGASYFLDHDASTEPDLAALIVAWVAGPDSVFGL